MKRFDSDAADRIEAAIEAAEAVSELEIVVRVIGRSDPYPDVRWLWGAALTFAVLVFSILTPWDFEPLWLLLELPLVGLLGWWLGGSDALTGLATTRRRRADHVRRGANDCFVENAMSGTRARTGVLVYASVLERLVLVLPDHGADAAAPQAEWDAITIRGRTGDRDLLERVLSVLDDLKELGAKRLPPTEDNPDELPNRPIMG